MKNVQWKRVGLALCWGLMASAVQAQTPAAAADEPLSCVTKDPAQRARCREFFKTHQWDEAKGDYVLKSGAKPPRRPVPPEGIKTRQEVRAERDQFMRNNRWDPEREEWVPLGGTPRELSSMSRADMRRDTAAFMRTHRWDEVSGTYLERKPRSK